MLDLPMSAPEAPGPDKPNGMDCLSSMGTQTCLVNRDAFPLLPLMLTDATLGCSN